MSPRLRLESALLVALIAAGSVAPTHAARHSSTDDWPSYGHDFTNQRFSPLTQITTKNVSQLRLAWTHATHPAPVPPVEGIFNRKAVPSSSTESSTTRTPAPRSSPSTPRPGKSCGAGTSPATAPSASAAVRTNRGVAVANGFVFVATLDARVIALNAKTGKQVSQVRAADGAFGYSFTMAPLVADGKVVVGPAGGEFEIRGFVDAYDVITGKHRWHYQMVPHDLWDYDAASPTVLMDLDVNGARVPAIAQAGKTRWVYILDRRTGKRMVRSEAFVPHENMWAEPTELGTRIAPGIYDGSNGQPMSYSPRTGLLLYDVMYGQHVGGSAAGIPWVRSTPVTYRVGGKQYVVVTTLSGLIAFALP